MNYAAILILSVVVCLWSTSEGQAEGFFDTLDKAIDNLADKFEDKAEQRIDQKTDEAMDSAIDSAEEKVDCTLGDKGCPPEAQKGQAMEVSTSPSGGESASMKCLATDVPCLKKAQSLGKQVEIVEEKDLDMMRCEVTDVDCLKKAKSLGIKVEIID